MSIAWVPHDYQRKALEFIISRGSGQLFLDPGLGKTSIMLQAIKVLRSAGAIKRTLIVAPLRPVYGVWPEEVKKWVNFENITVSVLHGPEKAKRLKDDSMVHVINFDGLQWLAMSLNKSGVVFPYDMLIIDEISYLKNTRTQRFKVLSSMLDKFKRRVGLTGSPAPNSLLDIFGPQLVIDRGATFGRFVTHFKTAYFYPTGFNGYEWKLQPGAEEKIYTALADKVIRMAAEDYLEMPPFVINDVKIELPASARKIYDELEKKLVSEIATGEITATTAAVAIMKCHQIANGGVYLDGTERTVEHLHNAKTDATAEIVEELNGKPVLIAYHYTHDLARLKEVFPAAPVIGSGVTGSKLTTIIEAWNKGEIQVLLAHPQSAGHGLNLQDGGSTIIWYSNTYNFEVYDQFNRRLYRQGQKQPVIIHRLIAKKTVDEAIINAVDRKDSTQKALMLAIQEYADKLPGVVV